MSKSIYDALIGGGLSPVGACAVMGNMYAESALKANIVEKRCTMPDEEYTKAVDTGAIAPDQFIQDKYGYGLCQWTYWSRKKTLLEFARKRGVSIGDEHMQCDFCVEELRTDYPTLYNALTTMGDLYTNVERVCREYENPDVKNINQRYEAANKYYEQYFLSFTQPQDDIAAFIPVSQTQAQQQQPASFLDGLFGLFGYKKDKTFVCDQKTWIALAKRMPTIQQGDNSDAVKALQCMLNVCGGYLHADGDWGPDTEATFERYKGGAI